MWKISDYLLFKIYGTIDFARYINNKPNANLFYFFKSMAVSTICIAVVIFTKFKKRHRLDFWMFSSLFSAKVC